MALEKLYLTFTEAAEYTGIGKRPQRRARAAMGRMGDCWKEVTA